MILRTATAADRASICGVHRSSARSLGGGFYTHEEIERWVHALTPDRYTTYIDRIVVAEEDGAIVGFAWMGDDGRLHALYVAPGAAGKGVGSALLQQVEQLAAERGLTSVHLEASLNAVPFYERHGFTALGDTTVHPAPDVAIRAIKMSKRLA
jgi:putative acetyltransferase